MSHSFSFAWRASLLVVSMGILASGALGCGALLGVDFDDAHPVALDDGGDASTDPAATPDGATPSSDGGPALPDVAPGEVPWQPSELVVDRLSSCRVEPSGRVFCWGSGDVSRQKPTVVTGLGPGIVSLAIGPGGVCALRTTGGVACTDGKSAPVPVPNLESGVRVLAASDGFGCAVRANGSVACWGTNLDGRLGNGSPTANSPVAVDVAGITTARSVSVGFDHACAVLTDGTARCWGANEAGQTGDGTTTSPRLAPVPVKDLAGVKRIAAGTSTSCAVLENGTVRCWGLNAGYMPTAASEVNAPLAIAGIDQAVAVDVQDGHACATRADGTMLCFGTNRFGELGDGTTTNRTAPAVVRRSGGAPLANVTAIGVGDSHTCALADGALLCWGSDLYGSLGVAVAPNKCSPPNDYGCSVFPVTVQTPSP